MKPTFENDLELILCFSREMAMQQRTGKDIKKINQAIPRLENVLESYRKRLKSS